MQLPYPGPYPKVCQFMHSQAFGHYSLFVSETTVQSLIQRSFLRRRISKTTSRECWFAIHPFITCLPPITQPCLVKRKKGTAVSASSAAKYKNRNLRRHTKPTTEIFGQSPPHQIFNIFILHMIHDTPHCFKRKIVGISVPSLMSDEVCHRRRILQRYHWQPA